MSALHLCGDRPAPEPGWLRQPRGHRVIDFHCHAVCAKAESLAKASGLSANEGTMKFASEASREAARRQRELIAPKLMSTQARIEDMDRAGIDIQVLSPAPNQYYYASDPELGRQLSRQVNETMAGLVASEPARFVGLGTIPLQSPQLAIEELHHAVRSLGLKGIEIGTHVAGTDLDAAGLEPVFAAAEELGATVFMHPSGFSDGQRLGEYFLNNIIGNPLESTIALSRLILSGLIERHTQLKLCVAHGGGYLPSYAGRMEHAYHARPECRTCLQEPPSVSLKRVYFDTLVHDQDQLRYLIDTYGADRLLLGSDYPYDMGDADPLAALQAQAQLSDQALSQILGLNAARLLGLQVPT